MFIKSFFFKQVLLVGVFTLQGTVVNLTVTEYMCSHCHDKFKSQATLLLGKQVRGIVKCLSQHLALGSG